MIEIKCSSINSIRLDFEAILLLPDLWLYSHDNNPDSVQSSPPECFGNFEENCSDRIYFENCYDFHVKSCSQSLDPLNSITKKCKYRISGKIWKNTRNSPEGPDGHLFLILGSSNAKGLSFRSGIRTSSDPRRYN